MITMVFVEDGGGGYWYMDHAIWNGLTVADLVFPWFIWMMGLSTGLSMHSMWRRGQNRLQVFSKVLGRAVKLLLVGWFLDASNGDFKFENMRIPGVLTYFAFTGFVLSTIHLLTDWWAGRDVSGRHLRRSELAFAAATPSQEDPNSQPSRSPYAAAIRVVPEVVLFWPEWLSLGCMLLTYLLVQRYLPLDALDPSCPTGYIGPGGKADGGKYAKCTGGAHRLIDMKLFTSPSAHHMLHDDGTCLQYFDCADYDPEGALGGLTACLMAFLGLLAGRVVITHSSHHQRLRRWIIYGVLFCAIGCALCGGPANNGPIPINKNLWSPSFVFTLGGLAFLLLSVVYVLIDMPSRLRVWDGMPLFPVGMNSILVYAGHWILADAFPFSWYTKGTHVQTLGKNLSGLLSWLLIAWLLDRRGFYLNL